MTNDNSRNVVITAAASGIGFAVAQAFVEAGDRVMICDIDEDALRAVSEAFPAITCEICDVSDRSAVEAFMDAVGENLGGIDVLVNNAGISGPTMPVEDTNPDAWDAVVSVNLSGTFNVTRLAIPYLKRSDRGVIIVMSSVAGRYGYPYRSAYSATKWGLVGFTKSLAIELGEFGIRANAILPGGVEGPRLRKVFEGRARASGMSVDEIADQAMAVQSIKRFVDPQEIAALTLFLASDHARSITGQMIPIDNDSKTA